MDVAQKRAFERAYLAHLEQRNGTIDAERRFARREEFLRALDLEPPSDGPLVAQETFDRHNGPGPVDASLDAMSLWAVTTAKANLSERYAIELQLGMAPAGDFDPADPQSYIDVEEHYHTRILADALRAIGLRASFGVPPLATRILIAVMIRLPRSVANVVILAAELGGVVLFRLLLEKARAIFAHQPKALAHIVELFGQIIADEIGHVLFVRSRLGRVRLGLARRVAVPIVARLYRHVVPEIDVLFGTRALLERMKQLDLDELRRIHPEPSAVAAMLAAAERT